MEQDEVTLVGCTVAYRQKVVNQFNLFLAGVHKHLFRGE